MSSERQAFNDGFDKGYAKAADKIAALKAKLERYERRENGEEFCEAHEDWLPMEKMQMDSEGVWLCQEAWDELVAESLAGESDE